MWQGGPSTGRFQYDDGLEVDADGYVTSVQGEPLDPERMYKVGSCERTYFRSRDGPIIGGWYEDVT